MSVRKEKILSIGEAAHFLKVSIDTLRNWDQQGKLIPQKNAAGTRRYLLSSLENFKNKKNVVIQPTETPINIKKYLLIGDAAKYLNVSLDTLRNWEEQGKIFSTRTLGGQRKYLLSDLDYIKQTSIYLINRDAKPFVAEKFIQTLTEADEIVVFPEAEIPVPAVSRQSSVVRQPFFNHKIYAISAFSGLLATLLIASLVLAKISNFNLSNLAMLNLPTTTYNLQPKSDSSQALLTTSSQVLAAETASSYLDINTDVNIVGDLAVSKAINGLTLASNADGFSVSGGTTSRKLTVSGGDVTLDQDVSTNGSPTFAGLTLPATSKQITLGGGILTWTPTGAKIITLPDTTGTVLLDSSTQTITNKTISGSTNTFSNIPGSALTDAKITITAGTNLSGGGDIALGGSGTISLKDALSLTSVTATGNISASTLTGTSYLTLSQTTAPTTTTDKLYNTSGALYWNGTNISAAGVGILPTGTNGQTLYNSSGTWTATVNLFNNGTNVGIGITNPGSLLEVNGIITATGGNSTNWNTAYTERLEWDGGSTNLVASTGRTSLELGTIATQNSNSVSITGGTISGLTSLTTTGNVGIGTTNPLQALDVVGGSIRTDNQFISTIATGTSPLAVSSTTLNTNLNADLLDGQHAAAFQTALTNPVTGTGTSNYIPVFTSASDIGNSIIWNSGGNVGIGTTNPLQKLDIAGNLKLNSNQLLFDYTGSSPASGPSIQWTDGTYTNDLGLYVISGLAFQGNSGNSAFRVLTPTTNGTTGTEIVHLGGASTSDNSWFNAGNVGIGNTNPLFKLDVTGVVARIGASASGIAYTQYGNSATDLSNFLLGSENGDLAFYQGKYGGTTAELMRIKATSGNVGIGTAEPLAKMDIQGGNSAIGAGGLADLAFQYGVGGGFRQFISTKHDSAVGAGNAIEFFLNNSGTAGGSSAPGTGNINVMGIYGNGNVGIGTTNPLQKLDLVSGGSYGIAGTAVLSGTTLGTGVFASSLTSVGTLTSLANSGGYTQTNTSANTFTGTSTFSNATYSALFTGGNVGIGTTAPGAKLEISNGTYGIRFKPGNSEATSTIETDDWGSNLYLATTQSGGTFNTGQLYLSSTGNVGIGTTNPLNTLVVGSGGTGSANPGIVVNGGSGTNGGPFFGMQENGADIAYFGTQSGVVGGTSNDLSFDAITNSINFITNSPTWSSKMYIQNNGNVGIGTTAPATKLQVVGNSGAQVIRIDNTAAGTSNQALFQASSDTVDTKFGSFSSTWTTSEPWVQAGSFLDATGAGGLSVLAENAAGVIRFYTGGTSEKVRIDNAGNIGIGTTGPAAKLDIYAGTDTGPNIKITGTGTNPGIDITKTGAGTLRFNTDGFATNVPSIYTVGAFDLALGANSSRAVTIQNGGNVGIGTTNPSQKLQVYGTNVADVRIDLKHLNVAGTQSYEGQVYQAGNNLTIESLGDAWSGQPNASATGGIQFNTTNRTGSVTTTYNAMYINPTGNVGIGITNPGAKLEVYGDAIIGTTGYSSSGPTTNLNIDAPQPTDATANTVALNFRLNAVTVASIKRVQNNTASVQYMTIDTGAVRLNLNSYDLLVSSLGTGTVYSNSGVLTNTNPSDANLKNNINSLGSSLDKIMHLDPVSYNWKSDGTADYGFIAQDVQQVIPELVRTDPHSGTLGLLSMEFIPYLTKAIQELSTQVNSYNLTLDSEGNVVLPKVKIDKLVLSPGIKLDGTFDNNYFDVAGKLAEQATAISTQSATLAKAQEQLDVLSASVSSNSAQISSQSAVIADQSSAISHQSSDILGLQAQIASLSAVILANGVRPESTSSATDSGVAAAPQNDGTGLNLTPPSILLATTSAQLVDLSVTSEATFSGRLVAYDLSAQNTFKSLGNTFLGNTTIAGDFSIDGTMMISGNSISTLDNLYIQNNPLAQSLDILNGAFIFNKDGTLIVSGTVLASQFAIKQGTTTGIGTITMGQTDTIIENTYADENSVILITPHTPLSQTMAVADKVKGGFLVKLAHTEGSDITFDYLIIGVK